MTLTVGTRLGAFEITGRLGAGGMGEVWRARDTKLGREVAIKTLPAALAEDADRLARFEREAQLLAALNHAHIAAVHSLDETDGTLYIVMELVEGQSLERRLESGPLPLDDALQYGLQIASALEAAHEKGVVHRDLKPANIMITLDGVIKVLDFGLAKAFATDGAERSIVHSPALSVAMTQQGLVLGTAGYMSPEQASGQPTDQRADIWAFGVVMFEMLTGQALFTGESVPHILADVLKTTPDWKRLPARLHPRLKLMLERCLTKRPRDRYTGIADARVDIEAALRDPEGIEAGSGPGGVAGSAQPISRRIWPVAAAFLIGLGTAGAAAWVLLQPEPERLMLFDITPTDPLAIATNSSSIAISPDGSMIAYPAIRVGGGNGGLQLRLHRLDRLDSSLLVDYTSNSDRTALPNQLFSPFFSPDGSQIGFYDVVPNQGATLRRISTQGGAPSAITALPDNMRGASWGEDGTIVYATASGNPNLSGLWRVRATGGEPERLTQPETGVSHWWPEVLPGAEAAVFSIVRESEDTSEIAVLSFATGEQRVLLQGGKSPHYVSSGHLLYGRAGTLFAVPFDPASLELTGAAVPVREGVSTKGVGGATEASISRNGTLVYLNGSPEQTASRRLLWVDTDGRETDVPTPPRMYDQVLLAPGETRAAVRIEGDPAIWIADLERGTLQRLPADEASSETIALFFSQDGSRIAYSQRYDGGTSEVIQRPTDGSGQREVLVSRSNTLLSIRSGKLTPEGDRILLGSVRPPNGFDIGLVDIGDPDSYRDLISSPAAEYASEVPANGGWIAFGSNESGEFEIYVERFPDGGGRLPVTIGGGTYPMWTADGRSLNYLATLDTIGTAMIRVSVTGLDDPAGSPTFGAPQALFPWRYFLQVDPRSQLSMTADGERFLVISNTAGGLGDDSLILVQNWLGELERLAPED